MTDEKETTDELLASRHAVYGDRIEQMQRTAKIWSGLLGVEIHDWQVPLMMSAYKMLRTFETPNYSDNSDDIFGWGKMFVEVMDANHGGIVQARTVEEYQAKLAAATEQDKQACRSCGHAPHAPGRCLNMASDRDCLCSDGPKHPYVNVERDAEAASMEAWRNREEKHREPRGS